MWANFIHKASIVLLVLMFSACQDAAPPIEPLPLGSSLPALQAQGWLNGPAPDAAALHNKVVVIDAWAYWCAPCVAEMPKMVELHRQLADASVQFVGLTAVEEDALDETRLQLVRHQVNWPNGYGAADTLRQLGVISIPAVLVFDPQHKLCWRSDLPGSLPDAIQTALSQD